MRQRNDTGFGLVVHTDPPRLLEPGEEVDHDVYLIGLTVLDAADAEPATEPNSTESTHKPASRAGRSPAKEANA